VLGNALSVLVGKVVKVGAMLGVALGDTTRVSRTDVVVFGIDVVAGVLVGAVVKVGLGVTVGVVVGVLVGMIMLVDGILVLVGVIVGLVVLVGVGVGVKVGVLVAMATGVGVTGALAIHPLNKYVCVSAFSAVASNDLDISVPSICPTLNFVMSAKGASTVPLSVK
jgi:hypothetical protein